MLWLLMMGVNEQQWKEQASPRSSERTSEVPTVWLYWSGLANSGWSLPGSNRETNTSHAGYAASRISLT